MNLSLSNEKCNMMMNEGIVLGHHISSRGIEVDKNKVKIITLLPTPLKDADPPTRRSRSALRIVPKPPRAEAAPLIPYWNLKSSIHSSFVKLHQCVICIRCKFSPVHGLCTLPLPFSRNGVLGFGTSQVLMSRVLDSSISRSPKYRNVEMALIVISPLGYTLSPYDLPSYDCSLLRGSSTQSARLPVFKTPEKPIFEMPKYLFPSLLLLSRFWFFDTEIL
jgi:hypothetical protein